MLRTFKCRLYPTKAQQRRLENTLDLCRRVFTRALETRKTAWEQRGKPRSYVATVTRLPNWKAKHQELQQVHSHVLQNVHMRADLAIKAFYHRVKAGETPGDPRFTNSSIP
jgi:putative transposase